MHKGFTVWLTGLSGAGKSTLAQALRERLQQNGRPVEVLDGDEVRTHLSRGLGFSRADRDTNVARIAFVSKLLTRNGAAVVTAAISPYAEARRQAREQIGSFVEVYVRCPLEELVRRDVKGLYERALRGELPNFTGVSDPYEAPENPDVVVHTDSESVEESLQRVLRHLEQRGYLGSALESQVAADPEALTERARSLPRLDLSGRQARDLLLIGNGAYSPLQGFLEPHDYASVLEGMRLASGAVWPLPVTLAVADRPAADELALYWDERLLGVVAVNHAYPYDKAREARQVYQTEEAAHPGVAALYQQGDWLVGGPVEVLPQPSDPLRLTPRETRAIFAERGWQTVVGFQTRNPVHRAHEYLQKCALELVDGLLLHPLIGDTKADDIPADVRLHCYEALLSGYYPAHRVLLSGLDAPMRYAGPREALFHALVRKNFGCTHFIVGRDHAGVGKYYGTYDAQNLFDRFAPHELGIIPLKFENSFYCKRCDGMASNRTCPHGEADRVSLSGTLVRQLLASGQAPPPEFSRPEVARILVDALHQPEEEARSA